MIFNKHPYAILDIVPKAENLLFWEERNVVTFLKFVANLLVFEEFLI
jgi:hypothetical protein